MGGREGGGDPSLFFQLMRMWFSTVATPGTDQTVRSATDADNAIELPDGMLGGSFPELPAHLARQCHPAVVHLYMNRSVRERRVPGDDVDRPRGDLVVRMLLAA